MSTIAARVAPEQRFTRWRPCPICGEDRCHAGHAGNGTGRRDQQHRSCNDQEQDEDQDAAPKAASSKP
jgi:hypothetical protein